MKTFLEDGCRIQSPGWDEGISDSELFALTHLDDWALRDAILKEEIGVAKDAVEKLIAQGSVPPGTPGKIAIEVRRKTVKAQFIDSLPVDAERKFGNYVLNKEINGSRFHINVGPLSVEDDRAVILDAGNLNAKRLLKLWVIHLFLNLERRVDTRLVTLNETVVLKAVEQNEAIEFLRTLGSYAEVGRKRLLPLVPDASWAFVENGESVEKSRKEAWDRLKNIIILNPLAEFQYDPHWSEAFANAENWDEAMSNVPGGEKYFGKTAEAVFAPLLRYRRGEE